MHRLGEDFALKTDLYTVVENYRPPKQSKAPHNSVFVEMSNRKVEVFGINKEQEENEAIKAASCPFGDPLEIGNTGYSLGDPFVMVMDMRAVWDQFLKEVKNPKDFEERGKEIFNQITTVGIAKTALLGVVGEEMYKRVFYKTPILMQVKDRFYTEAELPYFFGFPRIEKVKQAIESYVHARELESEIEDEILLNPLDDLEKKMSDEDILGHKKNMVEIARERLERVCELTGLLPDFKLHHTHVAYSSESER
jgi:hypothetical protein